MRSDVGSILRKHGWGKNGHADAFNIPLLCEWMGLDPDNVHNRGKIYSATICYWRNYFVKWFGDKLRNGTITGENRFERWKNGIKTYNDIDAYVFFSRREIGKKPYFIQPSFAEMEQTDQRRLNCQMAGIITILKEMKEYDAHLVPSNREVTPMLEDSEKLRQVYLKDGWEYKTKRLEIK